MRISDWSSDVCSSDLNRQCPQISANNKIRNRRSGGNLAAGFCFRERRGRRHLCGHLREEHRLISLRSLLEFFSEKQRLCARQAANKDDSENAEKNVAHIYSWLRDSIFNSTRRPNNHTHKRTSCMETGSKDVKL